MKSFFFTVIALLSVIFRGNAQSNNPHAKPNSHKVSRVHTKTVVPQIQESNVQPNPKPQPLVSDPNPHAGQKIQWMTLEQAFAATQKEPRKILVDVYTGWCGWCKVMDQRTFPNDKVANFVSEKFYAVKLDAEMKDTITIGTQKYIWQNGYNQAGVALLQGKMSFPTIVYLDEKFNMIQPVPGFQEAQQFHQVITFFGDDHYKKGNWEAYQKDVYPKQYGEAKK